MAGGSSTAGKWTLGLLIYFFIFILVTTLASNLGSGVTYSGSGLINKTTTVTTSCETPRYFYDGVDEQKNHYPNNDDCDLTRAVFHSELCNSINGCQWDNVTVGGFLGFGGSEIETCTGDINTSYYNDNVSSSNICGLADLQNDENRCNLFGCTYYVNTGISDTGSPKNFLQVIVEMVSFQADIGLPTAYNYIFIFICFYIPLFALILAVGMYFRG